MDLLLPTDSVVLEASYDELYLNFPLFRKTIDENRISKYEVLHEYERVVRFITSYVKKPKEKLEGGALQCNIFNVIRKNPIKIVVIALIFYVIYVKPEWDASNFIEPIRQRLSKAKVYDLLDAPYTPYKINTIANNDIVKSTYPELSSNIELFKERLRVALANYKPYQTFYDWFFAAGEWTSFFTNVYSTLTRLATQNPIFAAISSAIIALLLAWGICKEVPDAVAGAAAAPAALVAAPAALVAAPAAVAGALVAAAAAAPAAVAGALVAAAAAAPAAAPPAAQAQAQASSSGGEGGGGGGGGGEGGNGRRKSFTYNPNNGEIKTENYSVLETKELLQAVAAAQAAAQAAPPAAQRASRAPSPSAVRRRRGSARGGMRGGNSRSRSIRSRSRRSRSIRSRIVRSRSRTNQKIKNQFKRFIGYVQKQDNFQLKGLEGGALLKRGLRCVSASLGLSIMIILVFVIGIYFASIQVVNIDFETILKLVEHKLIGLLPDFLIDKRANGGSWYAVLREIFAVANAKAYMYIPVDKDFTFGVHPAVTAVIGLLITKVLKAIGDGFNFIFDLPKFIWKSSDTLSTRYMDLYNLCSDFLCEEIPKSKELVQSIIKSTEKVAEKLNLKEIVPKVPKTTTKRQIAVPLPRNAPLLSSKASQSSKTLVLKDAEPKK
jgi:hypothetical protein